MPPDRLAPLNERNWTTRTAEAASFLRGSGLQHGADSGFKVAHRQPNDHYNEPVSFSVQSRTSVPDRRSHQESGAFAQVVVFTPFTTSTTMVELWGPLSVHA